MAEAIVETIPPTRFFCHMCNVEINIPNTDYTCPLCAGGFVEELPAINPSNGTNSSAAGSSATSSAAGPANEAHNVRRLDALRDEIATLLMSRNGGPVEISIDPVGRRSNLLTFGGGGNGTNGGNANNTGGGRVRGQQFDRLDNVLFDFLQSISGGEIDMTIGNSPMFFMGNPGDYAWGREGIDTIVTQLLNQMETSGPPPLTKDKIAEIPKVAVTAEEEERKIQCSVCWEDFRQDEVVRKLPCAHLYHENCIVPWLDLHGTCPICRKSLADETAELTGSNSVETASSQGMSREGRRFRNVNVFIGPNGVDSGGGRGSGRGNRTATSTVTNGPTTSQAGPTQNQQQQNNVFTFDEGLGEDEDLD